MKRMEDKLYEFVETVSFSKTRAELMTDEEFRLFQRELMANPRKGDVIQGTGGLRKVRCSANGHGKSGGMRIIYFYKVVADIIYLVFAYSKDEQDDLTEKQREKLRKLAGGFKNEG